uniref:hypothetical protein n=1 Tax=Nonomuraea sp. CA-251285 TaxID=3240002 RepID=UPI003F494D78
MIMTTVTADRINTLTQEANACRKSGEFARAIELCAEIHELARVYAAERNAPLVPVRTAVNLASVLRAYGDLRGSHALFLQVQGTAREIGDLPLEILGTEGAAVASAKMGDLEAAADTITNLIARAGRGARSIDNSTWAGLHLTQGFLLTELDRWKDAEQHLRRGLEHTDGNSPESVLAASDYRANLLGQQADKLIILKGWRAGLDLAEKAVSAAFAAGDLLQLRKTHRTLALAHLSMGNFQTALDKARAAIRFGNGKHGCLVPFLQEGIALLRLGDYSAAGVSLLCAHRESQALVQRCPQSYEAQDVHGLVLYALSLCSGGGVFKGSECRHGAVEAFWRARRLTTAGGVVRRTRMYLNLFADPADHSDIQQAAEGR